MQNTHTHIRIHTRIEEEKALHETEHQQHRQEHGNILGRKHGGHLAGHFAIMVQEQQAKAQCREQQTTRAECGHAILCVWKRRRITIEETTIKPQQN